MITVEHAASEAIFVLQLGTSDAVKYVVKHAGVSHDEAASAIKRSVLWYK